MAAIATPYNKPVLPRTTDGSDLGSNRASIYSGKGLDFDGVNDYVDLDGFTMSGDTATFCFYADIDNDAYVFDVNPNRFIFLHNTAQGIRVFNTNGWSDYGLIDRETTLFYTIVCDGTSQSVYVNGQQFGETKTVTALDLSSATQFKLGSNYLANGTFYNGTLSNYRIFNTALTAAQVSELYNNPEQAVPTGVDATSLVLHLPMTEGAGSYLYNANVNAIGTELISNAGFDETCQKWGTTDSNTVEIAGGKAIWTNAPLSGSFVEQPLDLEVGKFYRVKFDYTSTAFNIFVNLGDTQEAVPLGNGTYVYDMYYGSGSSSLKFKHGWTTSSSATVDNVSVKEVVPNYYNGTINGATWVQGLPEPLPQTALMDWNKHNQFVTSSSYVTFSGAGTHNVGTFILRHIPLEIADNKYYVGYGDNLGQRNRNLGQYSGRYWFVGWGSNAQDTTTSAYIDIGKDTTVAYSWDEAYKIKLYKNGVKFMDETKTLSPVINTNVYLQTAGDAYSSTNSFSTNSITIYLAMYDRVLSEKEVNDVYNGVVSPDSVSGCVHYWQNPRAWVDTVGSVNGNEAGSGFPILIPEGVTASKDIFGSDIVNPRASGAYNFDGKSWVQFQNNASLEITDAITLEFWARWESRDVTPNYDHAIGRRDSSDANWLRIYRSSIKTIALEAQGGTNLQSTTTIDGIWYHVSATISGTDAKLYVNGVQANAGSLTWNIANEQAPWTIGSWINSTTPVSNSYTYGDIANPRIYNYALTAEQVADNFNEKASTFGGTKVASELDAYIERTASDGATVEAHSCLVNYLTELDKK